MHRINTILITLVLLLTAPLAHADPDSALGDWHGSLATPIGDLMLIIVIEQNDDGTLSAHMESPDQAPGQEIPISEVAVVDDHLIIKVQMIGASIEADWDESSSTWIGTFAQGMNIPITLKPGRPQAKPIIDGLDGDWHATINRNGVDLRLILHITTNEQGTAAKLDSPDAMANDIPVSDLARDGDTIRYTIKIVKGHFVGTLTDPDTITGTWTLPDQEPLEVIYTRTNEEPAERLRPQVPTEPYGYAVQEVTFENSLAEGVTLAGTLTLPEGDGPFPAAILISGSGPQDRDETVFGHQPFLVLADALTKQGVAVLRYDDRGTAESTGDYSTATSADFATDANAALAYLLTRTDINPNAIGFVGHSEGGLIAPLAITDPALGAHAEHPIAFMVMLAGPGTSSLQIVRSQARLVGLSQGLAEEEITKNESITTIIQQAIADSSSVEDAKDKVRALLTSETLEALGVDESQIETMIAQSTSPWTRYFLGYDPANYLPNITIPILALNGQLDLQVPAPENLAGLRALLKDHPDATITELEGLNHMFQHATTGALGEYNDIEETFAPEAMQIIADWINQRFGND